MKPEEKVEAKHVQRVEANGGLSLKWVSPGYAGVTDRIDIYDVDKALPYAMKIVNNAWVYNNHEPGPEEMRIFIEEILRHTIQFTELKRSDNPRTKRHQLRFHKKLRERGFTVNLRDE